MLRRRRREEKSGLRRHSRGQDRSDFIDLSPSRSRRSTQRASLANLRVKSTQALVHAGRLLGVLALLGDALLQAQAPWIDPADDEKHLGPPSPLIWTLEQKVAGFRNYDKIFPTRKISALGDAYPLPISGQPLDADLDDYFVRSNIAGLLVIEDGAVVYERYGLGNAADTRWVSYSVAKSVTSMLIGAAIRDGYIESVDEAVSDYVPRLRGTPYEQTSIRHLMQMASGVQWDETYDDPSSDVFIQDWGTLFLQRYLRRKPRVAPPGTKFNYNTAETNLVGMVLRAAIGNNLSTYLEEKIWRPFGMESSAHWMLTEPGGGEFGGCCISATLRDYARLGLFALSGGVLPDGARVLPDGWIDESTTPSPPNEGYGYLWWIQPHGGYAASGIFGQRIYVHPEHRIVIAQHAARAAASKLEDRQAQAYMEKTVMEALNR